MRIPLLALLFAFTRPTAGTAVETPLARAVAEARTKVITPRATLPQWIDWHRISRGLAFYQHHAKAIGGVLATSSLVETYAAVDIAPVLMRTGRLAREYDKRIDETREWIDSLLKPQPDLKQFQAGNYRRAVDLGKLHAGIASSIPAEDLGWTPDVRVPVNQQAYAFVLYSFAWQPLESLRAMQQLDVTAEASDVEGWCHLWSVLGYAMGVVEELLPRSYTRASEVIPLLRSRQYAAAPAEVPRGVPVLLRGELRMLIASGAHGSPASWAQSQRSAAQMPAGAISLSPGLQPALGLSDHPTEDLLKLLITP